MRKKEELRKEALEARKSLNSKDLSKKIIQNLLSLKEYQKSQQIICYYPLMYEVDTRECFKDKAKIWYLPRVRENSLDICLYGETKTGSFGILEPIGKAITDYSNIDAVIIPACAADLKGFRLGWGKGYYDRFLPLLKKECIKIILIYSSLVYKTVYPEEYDINADIIVTDKNIIYI